MAFSIYEYFELNAMVLKVAGVMAIFPKLLSKIPEIDSCRTHIKDLLLQKVFTLIY